ncbi:hypothetical protein HanRHA438_Chr11g0486471 [Helianthus annuus]|nr:hypothetical protein HanHA300_Chr11g0388401 [Helianthus annuus]KAJ0507741.1 hypothetical protein HanIR_Chr11g0509521 [Helianthus annuus]KAJ0516167.1 hypothetical protein HanHA89_Chr11g0410771 [Helianthus annuus]KAJ0684193.1 hypothetical protein HanLR1_Chr11g0388461 [Helianthus annuus]KAJ0688150.1 hypothetical protein HanOQP8_Chr11g0391131 [Helianthus annuus]
MHTNCSMQCFNQNDFFFTCFFTRLWNFDNIFLLILEIRKFLHATLKRRSHESVLLAVI